MDSAEKSLLIRRMKAEDAEEISRIYGRITKEPVGADFKRLVEVHAHMVDVLSLVAEQDGGVVGFMISYLLPLVFGIPHSSAWIAMMGVDPRHMGQGIGRKIAEETLSLCRSQGITTIHTTVRWDSTDILSFFKTLGFARSDFINLTRTLE